MKDIPVFTTEYGIASLILREIPYRQEAYIRIRTVQSGRLDDLLRDCAGFCRMAGAERIYASGDGLDHYLLHTAVWELGMEARYDPDKVRCLFPVTRETASHWRSIYNRRMGQVDNGATLDSREEQQLYAGPGAYFVHDSGVLLGIGWLQDHKLLALASTVPGAGELVLHTLLSLEEGALVTLEVASTNHKALRLYEKAGFLKRRELSRWYCVQHMPDSGILCALRREAEEKYRIFQAALIPNIPKEWILGVRTPVLRRLAKAWQGTSQAEAFMKNFPHRYLEENTLHGFLICGIGDYESCIRELELFLPWVDNWATCDSLRPRCFRSHRRELWERIPSWLASDHPFTVRFGLEMLMVHFLEEDFSPRCLQHAAAVESREYYVNMMIAWFFATALANQWEAALPYLLDHRLAPWVHLKTIQKAVESRRVSPEHKALLKNLRQENP